MREHSENLMSESNLVLLLRLLCMYVCWCFFLIVVVAAAVLFCFICSCAPILSSVATLWHLSRFTLSIQCPSSSLSLVHLNILIQATVIHSFVHSHIHLFASINKQIRFALICSHSLIKYMSFHVVSLYLCISSYTLCSHTHIGKCRQ